MFTLKTFIIFMIYAVIIYFGRRIEIQLAARNSNRPGLILPAVAWIAAMVLSIKNFYISFEVQFSFFAFLASVVLFVFFAVPAMYFTLLYIDGRKETRAKLVARSQRMRQVHTHQRAQADFKQRYDSASAKQEPIIYMPPQKSAERRRITTSHKEAAKSGNHLGQKPNGNRPKPNAPKKRP